MVGSVGESAGKVARTGLEVRLTCARKLGAHGAGRWAIRFQLGDVSILNDGSECEKEIRSIGFFFSPPIPLSEDQDPSVDPSTRSRRAAGKSGAKAV